MNQWESARENESTLLIRQSSYPKENQHVLIDKKGSSLIKLAATDANDNPITRWKNAVDAKLLHELMRKFACSQTYQLG